MDLSDARGPEERRRAILSHLLTHGNASVEDLAKLLSVSQMTVYRDVAELESLQLVQRRHGTISAAESSLTVSSARLRGEANQAKKKLLALAALAHMKRGMSLLVDDSTSAVPLVENLQQVAPITVVTNAEFIAKRVRSQENTRLILVGGEYEPWADAYFGALSLHMLSQVRADLCVMSATALTPTYMYHPNERVAQLKRQMLDSAKKRILLVDSSKFVRNALYKIGPLTDFDVVITDKDTPKEVVQAITDQDIKVEIAQ